MIGGAQVGLDDVLHPWYNAQRVQQARSIAASCSAAACRAAARTGVPASERPWVWATALGLPGCPPRATAAGATTSSGGADSCQATPSAAEDQRTAWWHLPNLQNQERLQLLCEAVKQQVRRTACVYLTKAVQPRMQQCYEVDLATSNRHSCQVACTC